MANHHDKQNVIDQGKGHGHAVLLQPVIIVSQSNTIIRDAGNDRPVRNVHPSNKYFIKKYHFHPKTICVLVLCDKYVVLIDFVAFQITRKPLIFGRGQLSDLRS